MRWLILPDIHDKIRKANQIVEREPHDRLGVREEPDRACSRDPAARDKKATVPFFHVITFARHAAPEQVRVKLPAAGKRI
jgi:hypothetical protein